MCPNGGENSGGGVIPKLPSYDPQKISFENYLLMVESMFTTNGVSDETLKRNLLLVHVGMDIFNVICSLTAPKKPADLKYPELVECLERHYVIKPSYHACLHEFRTRVKQDHESLNELFADLKRLALKCDFGANFAIMLRDQLFMAVDAQPYFKFLCSENFNLKDVTADALLDRISTLEKAHMSAGAVVQKVGNGNWKPKGGACPPKGKCKHCGYRHNSESCKFKNYDCLKCGVRGHMKAVCTADVSYNGSKPVKNRFSSGSKVKQVEECSRDHLYMINMSEVSERGKIKTVTIKPEIYNFQIEKSVVALEIDSGACVSLLPIKIVREIGAKVNPAHKILTAYGGGKIDVLGSTQVEVMYNDITTTHQFFVVEDSSAICGRDLMYKVDIGLTGVNPKSRVNKIDLSSTNVKDLMNSYSTEENKPINGFRAKVFLKPEAVPKFQKARVVPLAHKDLVDRAIDDLEKNGSELKTRSN